MVASLLPKNIQVSFEDLLQMEDMSSRPIKRHNWRKKKSQESLFQQLCKIFPEEGILFSLF